MAFCQPTFAPTIRQPIFHDPQDNAVTTAPSPSHRDVEQSQEWILFPASSDTQTQVASTARTPTAGLSRLSDFGSLDAKSRQGEGAPCETTDGSIHDDEDLDSLDEGLHAFQEPSPTHRPGLFEQGGSILPRHDGLGAFPASNNPPLQEQLWHFERFNPRKRSIGTGLPRRRSSLQRRIDADEDNDVASIEAETRERIEQWRMEQSRVLADEIERETRRRRASVIKQRAENTPGITSPKEIIKDSVAENYEDEVTTKRLNASSPAAEDSESFWQRITRRVIRDFIGIDDNLLSIIFGESLPTDRCDEKPSPRSDPSSMSRSDSSSPGCVGTSWEGRLLDRLSRELGILLQQLTEHPGAFSTLSPFSPSTLDYAGMPVVAPSHSRSQPKPSTPNSDAAASFDFRPTLQDVSLPTQTATADSTHAALWGIEEEPAATGSEDDHAYWEQTPDIKTVFRFLHNRFTSQRRPATASKPPLNIATTSTPDSLRRAAVIRQYHPLVSRAVAAWEQRHGHARRQSLLRRRSGSSCASSIVGSGRRMGLRGGSMGSSSRNYWDLGDSAVGSGGGSAIGVGGGGMGAWGEI